VTTKPRPRSKRLAGQDGSASRNGQAPGRTDQRWPVVTVTEERWRTAQGEQEPDWLIPDVFERRGWYEMPGNLGAGKTMVELALIVKYGFPAGFRFGRIDLENDFDFNILPRLAALGATYEQVRDQFVFLPDWHIRRGDMDEVVDLLADQQLDYLSCDAITDMHAAWGVDSSDTHDAVEWGREVVGRIRSALDPICFNGLDHFGRHNTQRAIGTIGKPLNVTGSWNVKCLAPFSRTQVGRVELELGVKNRTGWLPQRHEFRIGGVTDADGYRIVFERVSEEGVAERLAAEELAVLAWVREHGPCSQAKIEQAAERGELTYGEHGEKMGRRAVRSVVKRLTDGGRLRKVGQGRATRFEVV
jgi:hypothetical protein